MEPISLGETDAGVEAGGRRRLPTLPQPRASPRSSFSGPSGSVGGGVGVGMAQPQVGYAAVKFNFF